MNTTPTIDLAFPTNDYDGRAQCAEMAALIKRELSTRTSPDECVYLHATLVETLAMLGEVAPTLESVAPLMQSEGVDMAEVRARVAEQQKREEAEYHREIALFLAQREIEHAIETYGIDSPQTHMAMAKGLKHLPDAVMDDLVNVAHEMGLVPKAAGYTDAGHPVFAAEDIAQHFGMDESEVIATMEADPSLTVDAASVHRVQ